MCFSANASFGSASVLLVTGVISLRKIQSPSQILFAAIPLLFCFQQGTEGFIWLSLEQGGHKNWEEFSTRLFLLFAQVLWPVWVPLSVFKLEADPMRKKILLIPLITGFLLAIYMVFCLFTYPVKSDIVSYHIHYTQQFPPAFSLLSGIIYFLSTIIPCFISGSKMVQILGVTILASYLFTQWIYPDYIISVWCFFAAIISIMVLYIVINLNQAAAAKNAAHRQGYMTGI